MRLPPYPDLAVRSFCKAFFLITQPIADHFSSSLPAMDQPPFGARVGASFEYGKTGLRAHSSMASLAPMVFAVEKCAFLDGRRTGKGTGMARGKGTPTTA